MSVGASIRAGEAYVEGTFRDGKLVAGLQRGTAHLKAFAGTLKNVGLQVGAAGAAITAPLVVSLNTFRKMGSELADMSARTGASVRALSELKFAASQSGTSIEKVEAAIKNLQKTLLAAEQGSAPAIAALDALGLSAEALRNLKPEDQLALVAAQLRQIKDPGMQAAAAMEILGKSGQELTPMLRDLEALRAQARELGLTMSPENAAAADALDDAMDVLNRTFEGTRAAVGAATAAMATDYVNALTAVSAAATHWINEHQQMVQWAGLLGGALTITGAGLMATATSLRVVILGVQDVIKIWQTMQLLFVAGLGPATVGLAAVVGVIATIVAATLEWFGAQQRVNAALEKAANAQTFREQKSLSMTEARFNQLAGKSTLTKAEQDEARQVTQTLREEFGVDASFNTTAGRIVGADKTRRQLAAAHGMRSKQAITQDIGTQEYALEVAKNKGETPEQIAERQQRLGKTREELALTQRIIAGAGEAKSPAAPRIGPPPAAPLPTAAADGVSQELELLRRELNEARKQPPDQGVRVDELAKVQANLAAAASPENLAAVSSVMSAGTMNGALAGQQLGGGTAAIDHLEKIRDYSKRTAEKLEANDGATTVG